MSWPLAARPTALPPLVYGRVTPAAHAAAAVAYEVLGGVPCAVTEAPFIVWTLVSAAPLSGAEQNTIVPPGCEHARE